MKSDEDLRIAFESGAAMITGGSIAVKQPATFESWIKKFGAEKIILGADVKGTKIAVGGWLEESDNELMPFVQHYMQQGIQKVITTDISKDGMLQGVSLSLYKEMMQQLEGIYLIASGGVSQMSDILSLDDNGIPAVILGKAIYANRITFTEIIHYYK